MAVWVQRRGAAEAEPLVSRSVALLLLEGRNTEGLEPVLRPPVPGVDGVVRLPKQVSGRTLVSGGAGEQLRGFDQGLWLRPGEVPLVGKEFRALRASAQRADRPCLLPVHYPVGAELTLLSLEPRWIVAAAAPGQEHEFLALPIESSHPPAPDTPAPRDDLAWAVLYRAVRELTAGDRQRGMAMLEHIYQQVRSRNRMLTALVVRNGLAAALAQQDDRWRAVWLARARAFEAYDEVRLLTALAPYAAGDMETAVARLTRLLDRTAVPDGSGLISGGGASTYRAFTFRGRALARLGDLNRAVVDWVQALRFAPDYLPPLREIAGQRLHADLLDRVELHRFWIGRSPEAVALVAAAYARSSDPARARPILEAHPEVRLPRELRRAVMGTKGGRVRRATGAPGVIWEGPLFTQSSLARVNRELAAHLIGQGWDLGGIPTEPNGYHPDSSGRFRPLADRLWHQPANPGVWVRHHWPPKLVRPAAGKLVVMLPWEFGPVPVSWLEGLAGVDEIWVYSQWIRQGLIDSGVDPARIQVVPCGFDPVVFCPGAEQAGGDGAEFRFLYVGGTIGRKGFDLALQAFLAEFAPDEAAVLVVKDFGSDSFYRGASGIAAVEAVAAATAGARRRVILMKQPLSDGELAQLYRSADVLVAPYRAEGFCLPALEAMACGTPAILPAAGPSLDYAGPETALLVEAEVRPLGRRLNGMELAGEGRACQIRLEDLRRTMRWAFEHRDQLDALGRRAADHVHACFTWAQAAAAVDGRLRHLLGR